MLLVNHGKRCPRCAKNGQPRKASDGDCPLFGSRSAKEVLTEDPDIEQDSQIKHKTEDQHKTLVKQEGWEEDWDSVIKQDPDAGHSEVKHVADSEDHEMALGNLETGRDPEYKRQQQRDGSKSNKAVSRTRQSSRSTRYQAKTGSDEDANAEGKGAIKAEADL